MLGCERHNIMVTSQPASLPNLSQAQYGGAEVVAPHDESDFNPRVRSPHRIPSRRVEFTHHQQAQAKPTAMF